MKRNRIYHPPKGDIVPGMTSGVSSLSFKITADSSCSRPLRGDTEKTINFMVTADALRLTHIFC